MEMKCYLATSNIAATIFLPAATNDSIEVMYRYYIIVANGELRSTSYY